jgi:hypothetical protein
MTEKQYIPILQLCKHYQLEDSFFMTLHEIGLVEIRTFEQQDYLHEDAIYKLEKIIRIHQDLQVNPEGIDVVFNLLQQMEEMEQRMTRLQNRLRLYED